MPMLDFCCANELCEHYQDDALVQNPELIPQVSLCPVCGENTWVKMLPIPSAPRSGDFSNIH